MIRSPLAHLLASGFLTAASAQTAAPIPPPPVPKAEAEAAASIEPPTPAPSAPPTGQTLHPPVPGQVQAPAAGRIPEVPAPALTPVPPTPLASGQKVVPSTSGSGQFIVHGQDPRLKTAFSARCDEIKDELGRLLKDNQPWALPVVVLLNAGESARAAPQAVSTSVAQITHGGFHLQVTVNLRPDLRPAEFRTEVVRALLMERVLRTQPEVTSKRTNLLPDWVMAGVMEALDYRRQARPSTLFAAIFKSGKIFGIEEIIEASPTQMDALSKTIYRTSCCALVLALLDQPEGSARLNRFLSSLATDARPERELLNRAFPSFASSAASLNKWWALQLAGLSQPKYSEPLTPADTLKSLEDALTLRYQARPSEIPKPRPAAQPVLASSPPQDEPAAPKPGPGQRLLQVGETILVTDAPPEEPSEETKDKDGPGFFRNFVARLNPFSKRRQSNAAIIETAIEQAAREEALSGQDEELTPVPSTPLPTVVMTTEDGPRTQDDQTRKPLFNRWFGGGGTGDTKESTEDKPTLPEQPQPQSQPAQAETPQSPPARAPSTSKPSRWNPLNWFRRAKPQPGETSAIKPSAAQPKAPDLAFWQDSLRTGQAQALILQQAPADPSAAASPPTEAVPVPETPAPAPTKKRGILSGIFGGKKAKKEEPAPPAPSEPTAPAPAMPESAPKPADAKPPATTDASKGGKKASEEPAKKETEPKKDTSTPPASDPKAPPTPATPAEPSTGTAMTPGTEAPPAETAPPVTAEPVPEPRTAKRTPVRLKDLFGIGKKPTPAVDAPPADPAAPAMDATAPADGAPIPPEMLANVPKALPLDEAKKPAAKAEPTKTATRKDEPTPKPDTPKPAPTTPAMTATEPPAEKPAPKPEPPKVTEKKEKKPEPKPEEPLVAAAIPIEDYAAIMKRPDRKQIIDRNLAALRVLQERCAILFRPIVSDYILLLTDLREDKAKDVDTRLRKLRQRSLAALERSKAVRDLLDVHEANYSAAMSGTFDDYLSLPQRIQEELPPRQDPISRYLDALDREFAKP